MKLNKTLLVVLVLLGVGASAWYLLWPKPQPAPLQKIVVLLPSKDNPFWAEIRQGIEAEKASHAGKYDIQIMSSGEMDAADQVTQLRDALIRNVDGVVIGIADSRAPAPAIAQFNKKNIPVVLIDTPLDPDAAAAAGASSSAFIGSDNRFGGELAGKAFIEACSGKRVLLIKGSYVHKSAVDRAEGFLAAAKGHFEAIEREGEWSRQTANSITSGVVARQQICGIFASNDDMALGAIAAVAKLPQARRPLVIGFDATADGQAAIARGEMYASVGQQTQLLAREGVERLVKLLQRAPLANPNQLVPVRLITKSDVK